MQIRMRNLTEPLFGGEKCPEGSTEERSCNTHDCPDKCVLGPWTNWTECSATCDGGVQTRFREVDYVIAFMEARRSTSKGSAARRQKSDPAAWRNARPRYRARIRLW